MEEKQAAVVALVARTTVGELLDVEDGEERIEVRARVAGTPTPSRVVNTTGRKVRPRSMQPGRCLSFFSAAREVKSVEAASATATTCDGRRGHETVTSMATT